MRIVIDTDKDIIIIPNAFFNNMKKQQEVLVKAGSDVKLDDVQFIKDAFDRAIKNPLVKQIDAKNFQKK